MISKATHKFYTHRDEIKDFVWKHLKNVDMDLLMWRDDEYDNHKLIQEQARALYCDSGATKTCLFFSELSDYVIKIPYKGCAEDIDYEYDEYLEWSEFEHSGTKNGWDYCELEAKLYQQARIRNIEDVLCGTWFLGLFEGYPVYAAERADEEFYYEDYIFNDFDNSAKTCERFSVNDKSIFGLEVLNVLIDCYGFRKIMQLLQFIDNYHLNDFHEGNLMFKDGLCKVIDYSGYYEEL